MEFVKSIIIYYQSYKFLKNDKMNIVYLNFNILTRKELSWEPDTDRAIQVM